MLRQPARPQPGYGHDSLTAIRNSMASSSRDGSRGPVRLR
jgi:hypothetical protein